MTSLTLGWTTARDDHNRAVQPAVLSRPTPAPTPVARDVWPLLGTILATTLAMVAVILWASPTAAIDAVVAVVARS